MISQKNCLEPPSSNTGVESPERLVELGVDWLAGTFKSDVFQQIQSLVRGTFQQEFLKDEFSMRWYERALCTPQKITFAWQPRQGGVVGQRNECYLSIPGSALAQVSHLHVLRLCKSLQSLAFSCSRLDARLDDYSKTVTPALAYSAWSDGNISGFQVHKWTSSGRAGDPSGETLSLGRRGSGGSGKFLRIYDKFIQSAGEIDATRVELEMSARWSKNAFETICSIDEDSVELLPQILAGYISGAVDFVDKSVDPEHLSRCPRLDWWEAIVGEFVKFKSSRLLIPQTFERAKKWLVKQVAPTFAMIMSILERGSGTEARDAFFWDLWLGGETRMNDQQKFILAQSLQTLQCIHQ